MFTIEVQFLTGVSGAATPSRRDEPEWPPHLDRLFQAFVAAWGRNDRPADDERAALEWLERLDMSTLVVDASAAVARDVATIYVPPNDTKGTSVAALPDRRARKPRYFPAVVPQWNVVRYSWPTADRIAEHRSALERLAREVTYLGHSQTLVRVAVWDVTDAGSSANLGWLALGSHADLRVPYPGRLADLERRHAAGSRSLPSLAMRRFERRPGPPPGTVFDAGNMTVLVDAGGFLPSIEAFPLVAKRLRDALLTLVPTDTPIPTLLSGHDRAGDRARADHMAIVPLADVGWQYSWGRLMGIGLLWPHDSGANDRMIALRAVAAFIATGGELRLGRPGVWRLELDEASDRESLRAGRYVGPARTWATVLPAVMDRHPKANRSESKDEMLKEACRNVGLPEGSLDGLQVEVSRYSAVAGAPSVADVARALPSDSPYRSRPLRHAVLTFTQPITGPLAIGAGRFRGLGWCLPLDVRASP